MKKAGVLSSLSNAVRTLAMLWFPGSIPGKGKVQSHTVASLLLCIPSNDSYTRDVLCRGKDTESTGNLGLDPLFVKARFHKR